MRMRWQMGTDPPLGMDRSHQLKQAAPCCRFGFQPEKQAKESREAILLYVESAQRTACEHLILAINRHL
jgi:hypothetical protein